MNRRAVHSMGRSTIDAMSEGLRFRWLGAAGVELECGGERLLVDPYFSRVPFRYIFFSRPSPKRELVLRHLSPARAVLVTHPHFDHLMDVPVVCREYGATAYGSANAAALLVAHNVPSEQIRIVQPGEKFEEGPFIVEVFSGEHGSVGGIVPYTGTLPARLKPPLRLQDYRMDYMYSYRISAGGISLLLWNTPDPVLATAADALVISASRRPFEWRDVIAKVKPNVVILIHWDDFFSPLHRPLRPMMAPPHLGDRLFRRMDPQEFGRSLESFLTDGKVCIPELFQTMVLKTQR
jgi:L-ascorbate metabolism protein UlaG (beta-lactamase superfamily)